MRITKEDLPKPDGEKVSKILADFKNHAEFVFGYLRQDAGPPMSCVCVVATLLATMVENLDRPEIRGQFAEESRDLINTALAHGLDENFFKAITRQAITAAQIQAMDQPPEFWIELDRHGSAELRMDKSKN